MKKDNPLNLINSLKKNKETQIHKEKIFFSNEQIVLQEVPDEISLAISISGCKLKCKGCHSSFTWKDEYGIELTDKILSDLILKNKYISCVLFYGGEWKKNRLIELFKITKKYNKKICLYTGLNLEDIDHQLIDFLDFIKIGRYISELGNLNSKTTNQRFYILKPKILDITEKFFIQ